MPECIKTGLIKLIPKGGDKLEAKNYSRCAQEGWMEVGAFLIL